MGLVNLSNPLGGGSPPAGALVASDFANPTATISTTTATNGTAITAMRSDAAPALSANITGIQTITGLAGNMTITSGTGNSRTMILRTTTSGGTATAALTLDATQGGTFGGSVTTSTPNGGTAGAWKLGIYKTDGVGLTLSTTDYAQVDIGGTLYKFAIVT